MADIPLDDPIAGPPPPVLALGEHVRFRIDPGIMEITGNKAPQTLNGNSPMVVSRLIGNGKRVEVRRETTIVGEFDASVFEKIPTPPENAPVVPPEFVVP